MQINGAEKLGAAKDNPFSDGEAVGQLQQEGLSVNTLVSGGCEFASAEIGFAIFLLCYFLHQFAAEIRGVAFVALRLQPKNAL